MLNIFLVHPIKSLNYVDFIFENVDSLNVWIPFTTYLISQFDNSTTFHARGQRLTPLMQPWLNKDISLKVMKTGLWHTCPIRNWFRHWGFIRMHNGQNDMIT